MQLGVQQSFDVLKIFGDKAAAGGVFKTVADAVVFKQAVDTLLVHINNLEQTNKGLEKPRPLNAMEDA